MKKLCWLLVVSFFAQTAVFAADSDAEKKAALVKRLLELTGKPESDLVNAMVPPLRPIARNIALKSLMRDKTLAEPDRQKKADELAERLLERFRDLMMKAGVKKEIDGVSTEYLTSHFSTEEIQYLVTFYESDIGKSTMTKLPNCMAESQKELQIRLRPEFDRVAKEVFSSPPAAPKSDQ